MILYIKGKTWIALVKVFEDNYVYNHLRIVSETSEGLSTFNYITIKQQKLRAFCPRIKIKLYQISCLRFTAIY